ncbi:MAG: DNA-formamidopyrimidine glycosylase family protein, partial [Polyangiaceae bacterium]
MPELPDIAVYIETISARVLEQPIVAIRFASPFVLRTVKPVPTELVGKKIKSIERNGKRLVFVCEKDLFLVIHLMVSGRFKWADVPNSKIPGKLGLAAIDFPNGTLILTEASTRKRASVHLF